MWRTHSESEPLEITLPSGETIPVRRQFLHFDSWSGAPIDDPYGGKAIINLDGEPLFAELALLRLLQNDGFDGVWVDTYRRRFRRTMAMEGSALPRWVQSKFDDIVAENGRRGGCWDLLSWKGDEILFVESKRKHKDRIGFNQKQWLASALRVGFDANSFLIAEWDFRDV